MQTVLFQTTQFSISTQFSSIWPIDRILSGVTTPSQNGPGSGDIEGVLHIPQSFRVSPSDCLVPYPRHSLGEVLALCRDAVGVFYSPSWLGKTKMRIILVMMVSLTF